MEKLGILTDLHLTGKRELDKELQSTVDTLINEKEVSQIILLGDIAHTEHKSTDREKLKFVIELLNDYEVDFTVMLGNHDVENLSKEYGLSYEIPNEFTGTFPITDDLTGVYLDTVDEKMFTGGFIAEEDFTVLEEELQSDTETLLFTHHPVDYYDISSNPWFAEYPELAFCQNKWKVEKTVQESNSGLRGRINGHLHQPYENPDDTQSITANAFNLPAKSIPDSMDIETGYYSTITIQETEEIVFREFNSNDSLEREITF